MAVTGYGGRRTLFDEDQECYRTSSGNRELRFGRGCVQTSAAVDGGRSFPPTPLFSGPSDGERGSRRWSAYQRSRSPPTLHRYHHLQPSSPPSSFSSLYHYHSHPPPSSSSSSRHHNKTPQIHHNLVTKYKPPNHQFVNHQTKTNTTISLTAGHENQFTRTDYQPTKIHVQQIPQIPQIGNPMKPTNRKYHETNKSQLHQVANTQDDSPQNHHNLVTKTESHFTKINSGFSLETHQPNQFHDHQNSIYPTYETHSPPHLPIRKSPTRDNRTTHISPICHRLPSSPQTVEPPSKSKSPESTAYNSWTLPIPSSHSRIHQISQKVTSACDREQEEGEESFPSSCSSSVGILDSKLLSAEVAMVSRDIKNKNDETTAPVQRPNENAQVLTHNYHSAQAKVDPYQTYADHLTQNLSNSLDIPTFDGYSEHIDDFCEWMQMVDHYFTCANVENDQQIKLVVCKLRGRAQACWSQVVHQRKKEGKIPVQNWAMMKQLLSKQFLPTNFDLILFQQYRNCEQGNRTVLEYGDELHKLSMVLDLEEFEIQRVARFLSGLREDIRDEICLLSLRNLSEAIDLATRIENDLVKENEDNQEEDAKMGQGFLDVDLAWDGFEVKKDLAGFISTLDPFRTYFVGKLLSPMKVDMDGFKTKGARRRQWQIAWSFPAFHWTIVLVPLWILNELRRDFSVGVYHCHKPNRGLRFIGVLLVISMCFNRTRGRVLFKERVTDVGDMLFISVWAYFRLGLYVVHFGLGLF